MKSDIATIEARRNRLLELLSQGKSEVQAAEVLRAEGFPASHDTVERDVDKLALGWRKTNAEAFEQHRATQLAHLADLREQLVNPAIKPDRKIELALSILDREIELLGTKAPSKSITATVNADGTGRFHKFVQAAAGLSEAQLERVFQFAASLEREQLTMPAGPPPLMLEVGTQVLVEKTGSAE